MTQEFETLDQKIDQQWIDVVCQFWHETASTASTASEQRLHAESLVASQPPKLRARTALLVNRRDVLDAEWNELLPFWLECCVDSNETVKVNALTWLRDVSDQSLRNAICRRSWEHDCDTARSIAISSQYVPSCEDERSLFFFYNSKWQELNRSDPECHLLEKGYHAHCNADIRKRFCARGQANHRKELVIAMTKHFEAIDQLSSDEFEVAVRILAKEKDIDRLIQFINAHLKGFNDKLWQECLKILKPTPELLWQLAPYAPIFWAMKCLEALKTWAPTNAEVQASLAGLLEKIPEIGSEPNLQWRWLGVPGFSQCTTIHIKDEYIPARYEGERGPLERPRFHDGQKSLPVPTSVPSSQTLYKLRFDNAPRQVFFLSRKNGQNYIDFSASLTTYPDRLLLLRPSDISVELLKDQLELLGSYAEDQDRKLADAVFTIATWAQQQQRHLSSESHHNVGTYRLMQPEDSAKSTDALVREVQE